MTIGRFCHTRLIFCPVSRLILLSFCSSIAPNWEKSTLGIAVTAALFCSMPTFIACWTKFFTSSFKIRPLRPLPMVIFCISTPSSLAKSRTAGVAWAAWLEIEPARASGMSSSVTICACLSMSGAASSATVASGTATVCCTGCSVLVILSASAFAKTVAIKVPSETLSPALINNSCTVPAALDGKSILALSVSSTARVCSSFTSSPGLINTSITSISATLPTSGTLISINRAIFVFFR